ncbi:MAG TPA: DNA mismatch repair endonuclease MutL [Polyangiaceae bacterium]|nr:MAG: DNA mismatch repair protein MutL [Deltaproteobacteria bacterium ADurb.Bin207]HNS95548.1 DNA mismatch repair endonuclease MutL [Polyangiaceae bacterium]HNZ21320.1 DNA mismatch repair endonuclease MutL [Polyangiaceae bacterium]HOD20995.1 DNA mismatch repair endonuclease MutL [Polyangiaceae bacterium]HOE47505.1 DNA mismatch repair endonuclease MutL [Polyangiaceae bacterium]
MGAILRLSDDLCNQIAAGEVIERPASVVKELVENAIDAAASRIQIDIGAGGVGLVRVTDDGVGMDEQDARLAVERHATSKIQAVDDLLSLTTYGFRGEALPSIASVSRFTLRTRRRDVDGGIEVTVQAGQVRMTPCGMAPGTIVEVQDLLYNVPARRKFLKSTNAESAAITGVVESLALSQPTVSFALSRDGRACRQWLRASSRHQRAIASRPDDQLEAVTGHRGPLTVEAYLSPPQRARTGAAGLAILINDRVVRDRTLARVVAQAYGSVLEPGRYPVGAVYVDIDPALVDVNVHPQKAEVRFADARAVQDALFRIVTDGLAQAFGLAPASRAFIITPPTAKPSLSSTTPPWLRPSSSSDSPSGQSTVSGDGVGGAHDADPWGLRPERPVPATAAQPSLGLQPGPWVTPSVAVLPDQSMVRNQEISYGQLRFLAQLRLMFLLCEADDAVVVIDQHAAAERVTFAKLRDAYHKRSVSSQRLLVPATLTLDAEDVAFVETQAEVIESTGLEIRVVGPSQGMVTAVPQILTRADPARLARDLLDEVRRAGGRGFSAAVDLALATMACHGSIRAGDPVSPQEAQSLLSALDDVDFGGHCPHGRPLLMRIRFEELERLVGRR